MFFLQRCFRRFETGRFETGRFETWRFETWRFVGAPQGRPREQPRPQLNRPRDGPARPAGSCPGEPPPLRPLRGGACPGRVEAGAEAGRGHQSGSKDNDRQERKQ